MTQSKKPFMCWVFGLVLLAAAVTIAILASSKWNRLESIIRRHLGRIACPTLNVSFLQPALYSITRRRWKVTVSWRTRKSPDSATTIQISPRSAHRLTQPVRLLLVRQPQICQDCIYREPSKVKSSLITWNLHRAWRINHPGNLTS